MGPYSTWNENSVQNIRESTREPHCVIHCLKKKSKVVYKVHML